MSNAIEKTIDLRASIDRVWTALTDHDQFGAWFGVKLDGPFEVGETASGRLTYPGYENLLREAKVTVMQRPHRFAFTWHPYAVDPETDYNAEPPTLVAFSLASIGAGTRLTVTESGFDALPPHRRDIALRMDDSGWAEQMLNIKAHVET